MFAPNALRHPISGKVLTNEDIRLAKKKFKKKPSAIGNPEKCTQCKEKKRFDTWPFCWECGRKHMNKNVRECFEDIRIYQGDHEGKSFNFAAFTFRGLKLSLAKKSFRNCTFFGARFSNINFKNCKFENIDFTGATFRNCSFRNTTFKDCWIPYVGFEQTNFGNTRIFGLRIFSSLFKCQFKKTKFAGTHFEECTLDSKFRRSSGITQTNFNNCDMSKCDLRGANINDPNVTIRGEKTKAAGLRLSAEQTDLINFSEIPRHEKENIYFLSPVWQKAWLFDINYGIRDKIRIAASCVAIGNFLGLLYCVFTSFFRDEPFLKPFFSAWIISSSILLVAGLYSSIRITRSNLELLAKIKSEDLLSVNVSGQNSEKVQATER